VIAAKMIKITWIDQKQSTKSSRKTPSHFPKRQILQTLLFKKTLAIVESRIAPRSIVIATEEGKLVEANAIALTAITAQTIQIYRKTQSHNLRRK
jgi:hypothetical protein